MDWGLWGNELFSCNVIFAGARSGIWGRRDRGFGVGMRRGFGVGTGRGFGVGTGRGFGVGTGARPLLGSLWVGLGYGDCGCSGYDG